MQKYVGDGLQVASKRWGREFRRDIQSLYIFDDFEPIFGEPTEFGSICLGQAKHAKEFELIKQILVGLQAGDRFVSTGDRIENLRVI